MIFKKIFGAVHAALKNEVFENFAIKEEAESIKQTVVPSFEEITFKIKEEEEKVKFANSAAKAMMEQGKDLKVDNSSLYEDKTTSTYVSNSKYDNNSSFKSINHDEINKNIINIPVDLKLTEKDTSINIENKNSIGLINNLNSKITNENMNETTHSNKRSETLKTSFDDAVTKYVNNLQDVDLQNSKENNSLKPIAKFPPITIIGQYNKTYILGEHEGTLYMIDQHAAHEKILFEKYLKEIEEGTIVIQPLMVPSIIDLSIDDYSYFEENKEIFNEAGFLLQEFGGNSLSLKEVPYFLGRLNPKKLFLDILDNLKNLGNGKTSEVKHNAIASKACKAAIKGNDKLEINEMIKLVEDLRYIDDPFHCPHGRPVIIKFTSIDIDKKFRRII